MCHGARLSPSQFPNENGRKPKTKEKCSGEAWPILHSIGKTESRGQTWLLGRVGLGTWQPPSSHTVTMEGDQLPYVFLPRTDRRLIIIPILDTSLSFREVNNSPKFTISHRQHWEANWVCFFAAMNPKPELFFLHSMLNFRAGREFRDYLVAP